MNFFVPYFWSQAGDPNLGLLPDFAAGFGLLFVAMSLLNQSRMPFNRSFGLRSGHLSLHQRLRLVAWMTHGLKVQRVMVVATLDVVHLGRFDRASTESQLTPVPIAFEDEVPKLWPVRRQSRFPGGARPSVRSHA